MIDIAGRKIGSDYPCFIIAEAGVNHNNDIILAKQLVDVAVEAGADAVKFQTFKAENLVSTEAPKARYQLGTTDADESQFEMLRKLELSLEAHRELQAYCQARDIVFMSTPFDQSSADFLDELGVPVFKIGSGEVTNWPLLKHIARKNKPVIFSTGMSYLSEVDAAVRLMHRTGNSQIVVLHCVTNYPAEPSAVNLRAMLTLSTALQVPVGYSDHTPGIAIPLAAVALGACVLEKHFTLDKTLPGPDHRASLDPQELQLLVEGVRSVEQALGSGLKTPASTEFENRAIVRRSLAAAQDIAVGNVFTEEDLMSLRPANGISPTLIENVVGRTAKRSLKCRQMITWEDLT